MILLCRAHPTPRHCRNQEHSHNISRQSSLVTACAQKVYIKHPSIFGTRKLFGIPLSPKDISALKLYLYRFKLNLYLYSFKFSLPGTAFGHRGQPAQYGLCLCYRLLSFSKTCLRSGHWEWPMLAPKHCLRPAGRAAACLDWVAAQMTEFPSQGFSLPLFFDSDGRRQGVCTDCNTC